MDELSSDSSSVGFLRRCASRHSVTVHMVFPFILTDGTDGKLSRYFRRMCKCREIC